MASPPVDNTITVFIDSTVLVAASISSTGAGRNILDYAVSGKLDAYISDDVLEETEKNLSLKVPQALPRFYAYRDRPSLKVVNPSHKMVTAIDQSVEPKDAPIAHRSGQDVVVWRARQGN